MVKAIISTSGHLALGLIPLRRPLIHSTGSPSAFWSRGGQEFTPHEVLYNPRNDSELETVMAHNAGAAETPRTSAEPNRIHLHLWNSAYSSLRRLFRIGKRIVSVQVLFDVLRGCTFRRIGERAHRPIVAKYIPDYPCRTIFMDICYPERRDRNPPCLLITDALSRFIHGRFTTGIGRGSIISGVLTGWPQWLGVPKKIITDAGTCFAGEMWGALSSIYCVSIIQSPADGHFREGKVDRYVDLFMRAYEAIHTHL